MITWAGTIFSLAMLLTSRNPLQPPSPPPPPGPPPKVVTTGSLDRSIVRYYIRLQTPGVYNCYAQELARRPKLRAAVTVELQIDATGRVSACNFGGTPFEQCVARVVCATRFPTVFDKLSNGQTQIGTATTHVRYRFRFRPRSRRPRGDSNRRTASVSPPAPAPAKPSAVTQPVPASRPAPAASQPAQAAPPPPSRQLPKLKLPVSNDPLEGIGH
jgi:hypothetical protein